MGGSWDWQGGRERKKVAERKEDRERREEATPGAPGRKEGKKTRSSPGQSRRQETEQGRAEQSRAEQRERNLLLDDYEAKSPECQVHRCGKGRRNVTSYCAFRLRRWLFSHIFFTPCDISRILFGNLALLGTEGGQEGWRKPGE